MHPIRVAEFVDVDPLEAARGLADQPGTVLLHDQTRDGASILLFDPRWTCWFDDAGAAHWSGDVPAATPPADHPARWPMTVASAWLACGRRERGGGLAGWLGFDLGPAAWNARHRTPAPFDLPEAWFGAYDIALVFGGSQPPRLSVSDLSPWVAAHVPPMQRWEEALARLGSAARRPAVLRGGRTHGIELFDRGWHARAVEAISRHLRAGDIYQANLTGFTTAHTSVHPWSAFVRQAEVNPVPWAAYVNTGDAVITSHSPERLLSLRGRRCLTSPIKGTAPADALPALLASAKDRAEHVMIVDLCRHDLGRICEFGSVRTLALMAELRVEGLVHLVSHIEGRLRKGARRAAIESLFPGGSVTGAPKRRALEIIGQVEASRRGPYTGSIGLVDRSGRAEWSIAIRTAVWQNERVAFGCGGGIVLDSDPDREYAEAQWKAASFLRTLQGLSEVTPAAARAGGI